MKVTFHEPFTEKLNCREWELEIKTRIPVKRLLEIMAEQHPYFNTIRDEFIERYPYGGMLLLNKRNIARIDDYIDNTDSVEVIPPIMGG